MATIAATSLTRFELTDLELKTGQILSLQTKQVIQNLLADYSEEKINLKFDPEHPQYFVQEEAELQGKIGVLKYILDCSTTAEQDLLQQARADAISQNGE